MDIFLVDEMASTSSNTEVDDGPSFISLPDPSTGKICMQ